jgi:hypothetical protein
MRDSLVLLAYVLATLLGLGGLEALVRQGTSWMANATLTQDTQHKIAKSEILCIV